MKKFKKSLILFIIHYSLIIIIGCGTTTNKQICPECHMPLPKNSKINTAYLNKTYFDDIGCMILWIKKHNSNVVDAKVFAKDSQKYIKAINAHYTINERTPMGYGFTAYEKFQKGSINFKEMRLRMLRGETMQNPKIRKQILGE
jgi:hypothetical protein